MFTATIQLSTVDRVKDFVSAISDFDFNVDLISGRYCVNAKSIMGIFSLDLGKSITLEADVPTEFRDTFTAAINPFEV
ncbi:MAG: HPr family phosphocarrier protein [Angelakisella sp.]